MATGNTLDDQKREHIKALLSTGQAKNAIARAVGVSWATVDKISKEAPDDIENMREQKRAAFIERLWGSMDRALGLADKKISLAMDAAELLDKVDGADISEKTKADLQEAVSIIANVPLGQISTFIGTIYDKRALMLGESTANTQTTIRLEGELDEWAN